MARLVLGDEHEIFLDALASVLQRAGHQVLGTCRTGSGVLDLVRDHRPDICLVGREFASADGMNLIGPLRHACPATRVLVLSAGHDVGGMRQALSAGALGYVHKSRGVAALMVAIGQVADGRVAVDMPDARSKQPAPVAVDEDGQAVRRLAAHLTPREWQCLQLLASGLDTAEIMAELGVSRTTIRTHIQAVLFKLGVHSRLQAVSLALRHGLLAGDRAAGEPASADASAI